MKNKYLLYTAFQALKVLLSFLVVLHQLIHQQIQFFTNLPQLYSKLSEKRFSSRILLFNGFTQPANPQPLKEQNPVSVTKIFCRCSLSNIKHNINIQMQLKPNALIVLRGG